MDTVLLVITAGLAVFWAAAAWSSFGAWAACPASGRPTRRGRCSTDGTAEVVDALAKLHAQSS